MEIKNILGGNSKKFFVNDKSYLNDKIILISGAAGSIGENLTLFILNNFTPKQLILIDN